MLKNMKKIIVSLLLMALIINITSVVLATEGNKSVLEELEGLKKEEGTIKEGEEMSEIQEGTEEKEPLNENVEQEKKKEELPESTPYTGIGDYSGLIFVAAFGISAIYAYKKVKEYNA